MDSFEDLELQGLLIITQQRRSVIHVLTAVWII